MSKKKARKRRKGDFSMEVKGGEYFNSQLCPKRGEVK